MKDDKTIKPTPEPPNDIGNDDIPPIPKLRRGIHEALKNEKLAIFIGAGVSRIYGCDSWVELAKRLSRACYDKGKIAFKEKEHLLSECKTNSKKVITICKNILNKENYEDHEYEDYVEILKQGLKPKIELNGNDNIYRYMHRLSSTKKILYITTNIDNLLSKYLSQNNKLNKSQVQELVKYNDEDFDSEPNYEYLYHIHGHIDKPGSLVLTVSEYLERYKKDNYVVKFLEKIFTEEYTVLFVGYGLGELELLEYIATKIKEKKQKEQNKVKNKKYLLLPLYAGDKNILKIEKQYFEGLGIEVIPFQKDKRGYAQLEKVIKNWSIKISQQSYNEIALLVVKPYTKGNGKKIFKLISDDKPREDYFFECISKIDNPLDWLQFVYKNGYIKPDKVPGPKKDESDGMYWMPWWNAIKYLNAVAEDAEKINGNTSGLLIKIIEEHFNYFMKKKHDRTSINRRIENCLLRLIAAIPANKITEKHVEYIRFLLNSAWHNYSFEQISDILLPKLMQAKKKDIVIELFKVAIDYRKPNDIDKNGNSELESLLDRNSIQLRKLIDRNVVNLCPEYAFEFVKILTDKISKIIKEHGDHDRFNVFRINDITNINPPRYSRGYEKQLVYATVSLVKKIDKESEVEQLIKSLEKKSHPIFNRIKYCVFSDHFKEFPKLVWQYVEKDPPIKYDECQRERYLFLRNNAKAFDEIHMDQILEWIEKLDAYYSDKNEKQKQQYEAIEKKEWLSALEDADNVKVKELYDKYNKINSKTRSHPGYLVHCSFEGVKSLPSYVKKWRELSVEDIIKNIKRIKINNTDESGNIIYEDDLAREIKQWTINDPKKYADRIQMFIKNDLYLYLIHIIRGVSASEVRLDDKTWDKFFDDIHSYVGTKHVWSNKPSTEEEYYPIGFLISTMRLIKKLVKNKKLSNKQKQNQTIKKILLTSLNKCESTLGYDKVETDIISHFCNSLLGGILECSLEWMNTNPTKDGDDKWDEDFKKIFEKKLNEEKRAREFSVALGQMMPYLSYHRKDWLEDNIDKILPTEKNKNLEWKDTMVSILLSSNIIYKDLYNILRRKKHYSKALKTKFYSQEVTRSAISHICFGYLSFQDGDTIKELIDNPEHSKIESAINFFEHTTIKIDPKKRKTIKKFWKDVHEVYREKKDKESKGVLCSLAALQTHFNKLSDNKDLLKTSFKNVKFSDYDYGLLELLLKYVDKEPDIVAELMLETVKAGFCFYYQKKHLGAVVEKLYEHNSKDKADEICTHYIEKGIYDLKDIYDKYNKDDNNDKANE